MNDAREPGPETAGPDAPPPSPWWSRPDDQWSGPQQQPAYGSAGYGTPPAPAQQPAEEPWSTSTGGGDEGGWHSDAETPF